MKKQLKLLFIVIASIVSVPESKTANKIYEHIQKGSANAVLLQAVKQKDLAQVKVSVQQGATNIGDALELAKEYELQEIVIYLEEVINHQQDACSLVGAGSVLGAALFSAYMASYMYDMYYNADQPHDDQQKDVVSQGVSQNFPTFSSWQHAIKQLPYNRNGATHKDSGFASCGDKSKQWQEFNHVLHQWLTMKAQGGLAQSEKWAQANNGLSKPQKQFFDTKNEKIPFTPFAQKLEVEPGEVICMRGDLHGDIASWMEQLQKLKQDGIMDDQFKLKKGYNIMTLGDYVDRGNYGVEVIYTLMRLSLANPDQVFLVRGNHEETDFNAWFTFQKEVSAKFEDKDHSKHRSIGRMYDFLPAVIYMGCKDKQSDVVNYVQCCHGGVEEGYTPQQLLDNQSSRFQLLGILNRKSNCCKIIEKKGVLQRIKDDIMYHFDLMQDNLILSKADRTARGYDKQKHMCKGKPGLGFMWNDFNVRNTEQLKWTCHRGLEHGKELTEEILAMQSSNKSKVRGVLRGHQHFEDKNRSMMKGLLASLGVYKLWKQDTAGNHVYENDTTRNFKDGIVWTFNVAPDSVYGKKVGFDFDAMAYVKPQEKYDDWTMDIVNTYPLRKVPTST